jgi:hyperosmotically inducible protein
LHAADSIRIHRQKLKMPDDRYVGTGACAPQSNPDKESDMKTRIAVAVASLLAASLGVAHAQAPQQTPQQMPTQQQQPMSQPASPTTSATMGSTGQASNTRIEQQVRHELTSHGVTATGVTVSFNDGTATLSGTVYNQRDITKAKNAAMRVRGVKHVDTSNLHARKSGSKHGQG